MKKHTIILIIFFIWANSGLAQFVAIEGGLNYSSISGTDIRPGVSLSYKTFKKLGIFIESNLVKSLYWQVGFNFCSKGYIAKDKDFRNEVSIAYIEVPFNVLTKFKLDEKEKFKILAGAGPYVAIGLDYKTKLTTYATGSTSTNNGDLAGFGVKYIDLGFHLFSGFEIIKKIQLTGGFQPGLTKIFYGDDLGFVRNKVFTLRLCYFIR